MAQPATSEASYRVRLEGRAEALDVARIRLKALKQMLDAFRWRGRLRENTALLRETASAQGAVEEALSVLSRRAKVEQWPTTSEVMRCAADVERLANQVAALALRRLGPASRHEDLSQRLERLELLVLATPRLVLPGHRWKTAQQLLPQTLPEVRRAADFIAVAEPLFKRPMQPAQVLPFTPEEIDRLTAAWPDGQAALAGMWTRVTRIDSAGTLTGFLRRRSNTPPKQPARNGAEVLLAAEFWSRFAFARLKELASARVDPVALDDAELFTVVRWLVARQTNADARLESSPLLRDERAGLLELAVELASIPTRPQANTHGTAAWWRRLHERGVRAQPAAGQTDFQKLEDNLQLFLRVLQRPDNTPPVYRALATLPHAPASAQSEPGTLVELIEAMRSKLG